MDKVDKINIEMAGYMLATIIVFIVFFVMAAFSTNKQVKSKCQAFGGQMQLEHKYVPKAGCFVHNEGRWIHKDNLRFIINK